LSENETARNSRMVTKLREYWEKLPADTHLATMLCPYQKTKPLIHQGSTVQALTQGKMTANKLAKLQTDLVECHIKLLLQHAEMYQDAYIEAMESNLTVPVDTKRRRTAGPDVWEQFTAITALESEGSSSSTKRVAIDFDHEVKVYTGTPPIAWSKDVDSLIWWKTHQEEFPVLASMACDWLAVVATSVPCESVFSIAGNTITRSRNRLDPETAKALLCLKSWM
jgi:hypothetical protein